MGQSQKRRKREAQKKTFYMKGSVWPDWAIFESSWWQFIVQKFGDFWGILKSSLFK